MEKDKIQLRGYLLAKLLIRGSIAIGHLRKLAGHPDDSDFVDAAASDVNTPIRRRHHMADDAAA
jgi:hypothetical protein